MVDQAKPPKIVGSFIRQRREALGLSQRALGQLFTPPVTTQFISNVERGVTPLPPIHIPTLTKALVVSEAELMGLLEREFALKLSGRVGHPAESGTSATGSTSHQSIVVATEDAELMRQIYDAFRQADEKTRQAFSTVCESLLKIPRRNVLQGGGGTPISE